MSLVRGAVVDVVGWEAADGRRLRGGGSVNGYVIDWLQWEEKCRALRFLSMFFCYMNRERQRVSRPVGDTAGRCCLAGVAHVALESRHRLLELSVICGIHNQLSRFQLSLQVKCHMKLCKLSWKLLWLVSDGNTAAQSHDDRFLG